VPQPFGRGVRPVQPAASLTYGSNHAETPQQGASCDPQKSAVFSAAKIHAETSRLWHGTMANWTRVKGHRRGCRNTFFRTGNCMRPLPRSKGGRIAERAGGDAARAAPDQRKGVGRRSIRRPLWHRVSRWAAITTPKQEAEARTAPDPREPSPRPLGRALASASPRDRADNVLPAGDRRRPRRTSYRQL
jgi:hypothetical protein